MSKAFLYGNGGSSGTGGTLTVTAPAGVTVTLTKDSKTKTKTADSSGVAVFKGLASGTWTVTITDGNQTASKPVVITADYSTIMAFFTATINISYPAGSTCTATDGTTTLTAPDTSGTWACVVPNAGTWTLSCTVGPPETVTITENGQSVSLALGYYLYKNGDEFAALTGGWETSKDANGTISKNADSVDFDVSGKNAEETYGVVNTVNAVDLTGYSSLTINSDWLVSTAGTINTYTHPRFGVASAKPRSKSAVQKPVAYISSGETLDVSSLSGAYYIFVGVGFNGKTSYTANIKVTEVTAK